MSLPESRDISQCGWCGWIERLGLGADRSTYGGKRQNSQCSLCLEHLVILDSRPWYDLERMEFGALSIQCATILQELAEL